MLRKLRDFKKRKWLLRFVGLGIFIYILTIIDVRQTFKVISDINLYIYCLVVLMIPVSSLIKGCRLKILLGYRNIKIKLSELTAVDISSSFLGVITPGRIGELYKLLFLKRRGFAYSQTITSCVLDRVFDIFCFLILSLAILPFSPIAVVSEKVLVLNISATLFFLFLFFYVLIKTNLIDKIVIKTLYTITPSEYKENLRDGLTTLFRQIKNIGLNELIKPSIVTLLWWISFIVRNYFLILAFGLRIPIVVLTFCLCLIGVLSFLPISFSGIGTRDAVLLMFFSRYGANYEQIIAYSIMVLFGRFVVTGFYALLAEFYLRKNKNEKEHVKDISPIEVKSKYAVK